MLFFFFNNIQIRQIEVGLRSYIRYYTVYGRDADADAGHLSNFKYTLMRIIIVVRGLVLTHVRVHIKYVCVWVCVCVR